MPQGERRDTVLHGVMRQDNVLSGGMGGQARPVAAGRVPANCFAWGGARGQDIVLSQRTGSSGSKSCRMASAGRRCCMCGVGGGIVRSGGRGSSGSKTCRKAGAGRLFCVRDGGWGSGRRLARAGEGRIWARRPAARRVPGDCSARGAEEGEAAGPCYEQENRDLGLEELPRGERWETALRGARGGGGGRTLFEWEHGEFGLESLPHAEHRDIVLRGGGAEGRGGKLRVAGQRASLGSKSCCGASAGIRFCAGDGGA